METHQIDARAEEMLVEMPSDLAAALRRVVLRQYQEHRGKKIRAALDEAKKSGRKTGGSHPPYGFRVVIDDTGKKKLVADRNEKMAVALILRQREVGASYAAIAEALTERGCKPRGRVWYPGTVREIARRAKAQRT